MSKWETRNLPSVLGYVKKEGKLPERLTFSLAAMMAFYKGEVNGKTYPIQDDQYIMDLYAEAWPACDGSESYNFV